MIHEWIAWREIVIVDMLFALLHFVPVGAARGREEIE